MGPRCLEPAPLGRRSDGTDPVGEPFGPEVRRVRYVHRRGLPDDVDRLERSAVEAARGGVRALADLVSPGSQSPADVACGLVVAVDVLIGRS
jgi:hypothetical protein